MGSALLRLGLAVRADVRIHFCTLRHQFEIPTVSAAAEGTHGPVVLDFRFLCRLDLAAELGGILVRYETLERG